IHLLHLPGIFQGSSDHPRVWAQLLPVLLDPALGESEAEASCPQCRETVQQNNLIPNGQQANFLQLIKNLSILGRKEEERKGGVCEEHQEPLKLFCKVHEAPICVVCDRSRIHENHKVIPLKEALEEYKGEICSSLEILRKERGEILAHQAALDKESKDLLKLTETERLKIVEKFRELRQFLEEQEKRLLTHVEEVEKEIAGRRDEQLARLSRKLSSLEEIIQEMEEKSQQPASELLQDMRSTLERYEKRENREGEPLAFPPELRNRILESCDVNHFVEDAMKQWKGNEKWLPGISHWELYQCPDSHGTSLVSLHTIWRGCLGLLQICLDFPLVKCVKKGTRKHPVPPPPPGWLVSQQQSKT
uniref:B box-type domain-containing protein n=1 Tax=Podarcis muralis TaxID=64176 RepID=A0A670HNM1_PODMU